MTKKKRNYKIYFSTGEIVINEPFPSTIGFKPINITTNKPAPELTERFEEFYGKSQRIEACSSNSVTD